MSGFNMDLVLFVEILMKTLQKMLPFFFSQRKRMPDNQRHKKWWIVGITPTITTCHSDGIAMTSFCEAIDQDKCYIQRKVTLTYRWNHIDKCF